MLPPISPNKLITLANRPQTETLLVAAQRHYTQQPDQPAVTLISNAGEKTITYRSFFDQASAYANALRGFGVAERDLIVLVMEHGESLLYAFWGSLMMGAIPSIFPFLSDKLDPALYFSRVEALITHAGIKAIVASPQFAGPLQQLLAPHGVRVITESDLAPGDAAPDFAPSIHAADIAFLQHSSGTTGLQKGVALSHQAVLNQVAAYGQAIALAPEDKVISWLPLYHDMGLIAGFVMPITQGIPLILMSPFHWVRDPKILMHAINKHKATLCWLPNFAYNFMATRLRPTDMTDIRLDSMRAFINCSEPMRAESHRIFLSKFAPHGLAESALMTCYAMAENTFAVTQGGLYAPPHVDVISRHTLADQHRAEPTTADDELSMEMLSCGQAIPHCTIRIVDADRNTLAERHIGEVAVHSDSMLTSYYKRPDLTEAAMFDGWYLTGDYGYLANGELYITGRKKDLIIVGGKNIYPQDLEFIADGISGVKAGRSVAFGISDDRLGTEAIVMIAEAETDDEDERFEISRQIRMRIARETEVSVGDVLVVDQKWLHKTSSGKIARNANRDKYLAYIKSRDEGEAPSV
jgi:fatty-acyl-CoA synthase